MRIVKLELIQRVTSTNGVRLPVKVVIRGGRVLAQIGESGFFEAQDYVSRSTDNGRSWAELETFAARALCRLSHPEYA